MAGEEYLTIGAWHGRIVGVIAFIGGWIYCTATYGFLLGFGLGWIPSGILAGIVATALIFLWLPVDCLVVVGILSIIKVR